MEIEVRSTLDGYHGRVWHKKGDRNYYHHEDGPALIYDTTYRKRESWFYHNKEYKKPEEMPLNLFLAYCKWEYKKKNEKTPKN